MYLQTFQMMLNKIIQIIYLLINIAKKEYNLKNNKCKFKDAEKENIIEDKDKNILSKKQILSKEKRFI